MSTQYAIRIYKTYCPTAAQIVRDNPYRLSVDVYGIGFKIADKIAGSKRQGEYEKFIARLRAEAIIDWKNDEIKKAYEVGLEQEKKKQATAQEGTP